MINRILTSLCVLGAVLFSNAATVEPSDSLLTMTAEPVAGVVDSVAPAAPKPNLFKRIINYFNESNKPKEYKGFDWSIIGGPHFSSDTKLGIGLVAAGFYRNDVADTITPPSNVSLYGDVSTVGFYLVGIRGNHIFRNDKDRIDYNLYFYSFPRKFWGIGYENGLDMNNKSDFNEIFVQASANYLHAFLPNFYVGPGVAYTYAHASHMESPHLWDGLPLHTSTYQLSLRLQYDSRDNLTATEHGLLASVEQRFSPKFMGNRQAFSSTELKVAYFRISGKEACLQRSIMPDYATAMCPGLC